jgi:hypothetical protein
MEERLIAAEAQEATPAEAMAASPAASLAATPEAALRGDPWISANVKAAKALLGAGSAASNLRFGIEGGVVNSVCQVSHDATFLHIKAIALSTLQDYGMLTPRGTFVLTFKDESGDQTEMVAISTNEDWKTRRLISSQSLAITRGACICAKPIRKIRSIGAGALRRKTLRCRRS